MKTIVSKFFVVLLSASLILTLVPARFIVAEEPADPTVEETNEVVEASQQQEEDTGSEIESVEEFADENDETLVEDEFFEEEIILESKSETFINPEYEEFITEKIIEEAMNASDASECEITVSSIEDAVDYLVEKMRAKYNRVIINYSLIATADDYDSGLLNSIWTSAENEVDDYIRNSSLGAHMDMSCRYGYIGGGQWNYDYQFIYDIAFSNSRAQESQFIQQLNSVLDQLNLYNASDFQKIVGVYNYITKNVSYDYEAISDTHDPNDHTPWSAHNALIKKKAVCQGFSLLLYKMLDSLGVEVYYASGEADNGEKVDRHAWNVVKLKGNYYLLDATWDISSNTGSTGTQSSQALIDAQNRLAELQEMLTQGSLGFFKWHDEDTTAEDFIDKALNQDYETIGQYTNLGQQGDATSLANMAKAIQFIKEGNSLRASDTNNTETGKQPLMITDTLMAIGEIQANASAYTMGHTSWADTWENLAWGYNGAAYSNRSPYRGWYDKEIVAYEWLKERGGLEALVNQYIADHPGTTEQQAAEAIYKQMEKEAGTAQTGHYTNLVGIGNSCDITGYGVNNKSGLRYTGIHSQVFDRSDYAYYFNEAKGQKYTVEQYEADFNSYEDAVNEEITATQNLINSLQSQANVEDWNYFLKGTTSFYVNHTPDYDDRYVVSASDYDLNTPDEDLPIAVRGLIISPENKDLYVGDTLPLSVTVLPSDATNKKVNFTSSNSAVASVNSNGLVTAKKAGSAIITATTADGSFSKQCLINVTVKQQIIPVSKLTASVNELTLDKNEGSQKINVTVEPSNATDKSLIFVSSNPDVVTVDEQGNVTPISVGNANITIQPKVAADSVDNSNTKINVFVTVVDENSITVTLHGNGGQIRYEGIDYPEYTFSRLKGNSIYNFQVISPSDDVGFVGWYTDAELTNVFGYGNSTYINTYYIDGHIDLYAKYDEAVTLTLDFGDGYYYDPQTKIKQYQVTKGTQCYASLTNGYILNDNDLVFKHWVDEEGNIVEKHNLYSYRVNKNTTLTAVWSDYYTVTLVAGEHGHFGNGSNTAVIKVAKEETVGTDITPTVEEGYAFSSYYYDENYLRQYSSNISRFRPKEDTIFYAKISNIITVTFDYNGGHAHWDNDITSDVQRIASGTWASTYNIKPVREGMAFAGWSNSPDSTQSVNVNYTIDKDTTFYAIWKTGFDVVLHAGEGKFSDGSTEKTYRLSGDLTINNTYPDALIDVDPRHNAKKFAGWYTSSDLAPESYFDSSVNYKVIKKSTDFYAKYVDTVDFTFHANGGVFDSYNQTQTNVVALNKDEYYDGTWIKTPERTNMMFDGWYENPECTGKEFTFVDFLISEPKDLYAKWAQKVTLTIDGNGGFVNYANERKTVQNYKYNDIVNQYYVSSYNREGYIFEGYYYDPECTRKVNKSYGFNITEDTTFYLGWTDDIYTIIFDANGGTCSYSRYDLKKGTSIGSHYYDPIRENYAFAGWKSNETGKILLSIDGYRPTMSETFVAQWTTDAYTINLHSEHMFHAYGHDQDYNHTILIKKGRTVNIYDPYLDDYTFAGWYTDANFNNKYKDSLENYTPDRNIDLYAKWIYKEKYTLTIDTNGGYYTQYSNRKQYIYTATVAKGESFYCPTIHYKDNTKAFKGLSLSRNGSIIPSTYKITKDTTLYAIFDSNTYKITYDFNGGYDRYTYRSSFEWAVVRGQPIDHGPVSNIQNPNGDRFAGFTTVKNDFSTMVRQGWVPTSDTTLYAYWYKTEYQITFVTEGGYLPNNYSDTWTVVPGNPISMPYAYSIDPQLKFAGWYDNPEFTGTPYHSDFKPTGDMTLYAKFAEKCVAIFDANGRTFEGGLVSISVYAEGDEDIINVSTSAPKAPAGSEYSIIGWNTKPDGSGETLNQWVWIAGGDVVLYAQWDAPNIPIVDLSISKIGQVKRINVGESYDLQTTITPWNATYQNLIWSSSDSSIVSVNGQGRITGHREGVVTITAKAPYDNVSASIKVAVDNTGAQDNPIVMTIVDTQKYSVKENETVHQLVLFESLNNSYVGPSAPWPVRWSVSDESIATINQDGDLTGIKEGLVYVRAEMMDGSLSDERLFRVLKDNDAIPERFELIVDEIVYNNRYFCLAKGQSTHIQAQTLSGQMIDDADLIWHVDNPEIASIDEDGNLIGLKEGTSDVYAYSRYFSYYATYRFMVVDNQDDVSSYSYGRNFDYYQGSFNTQKVNQTKTYDLFFNPYQAKNENKIIQIDQNYLSDNDLTVNVSYVYENNALINKVDKMVYLTITGQMPGLYSIPFKYGKNLDKYGFYNITIIPDIDAAEITYNANGGLVINPGLHNSSDDQAREVVTILYEKNTPQAQNVRMMSARHPDNYAFVGWYTDLNDPNSRFTGNGTGFMDVSENLTLYAKWEDAYSITFDANGGYLQNYHNSKYDVLQIDIPKGSPYSYISTQSNFSLIPNRTGYEFAGWYSDPELTKYYAGGSEDIIDDFKDLENMIPNKSATYYAAWDKLYYVEFDPNGGIIEGYEGGASFRHNSKRPIMFEYYIPEYEGKTFVGWYYDRALTRPVDTANFVCNSDTKLFAKYADKTYTITFNLGIGSAYIDSDNNGSQVTKLIAQNDPIGDFPYAITVEDPSKMFNGKWYKDSAKTQEIDLNTFVPTSNMTVYAGYSDMITVTFNLNGGYYGNNKTTYDYYTQAGSRIDFPYEPKRDGYYAFDGWYMESDFINKVDFNTYRPTTNKTLYAKWNQERVVLTLHANGGLFDNKDLSKQVSVVPETIFPSLDKPLVVINSTTVVDLVHDQYDTVTIDYWAFDAAGENRVEDDYEITKAETIYAIWKQPVHVMGVGITDSPDTLAVGEKYQLVVQILPEDATNKNVTWTVDNPNVAVVTNTGQLAALNTGTVKITVTTQDGNRTDSAYVRIVEQDVPVRDIQLNRNELDISIGERSEVIASAVPDNATDKTLVWYSHDEDVAIVNDGIIEGVSIGQTTVTVRSADERIFKDITVRVYDSYVEIEELKFKENQISLNKGRTRKLEYSISPDNASNKNVTWSSSDPNIVTVDQDGNITGVNEGSAYVFAIANGSNALVYPLIGDFCIVNVTDTDIKVSEISFAYDEKTIVVGEQEQLDVLILPASATNKNIVWSSSDEDVASIDGEGVVRAIAQGQTYIRAAAEENEEIYDEILLNVENYRIIAQQLTLDESQITLVIPSSKTLIPTFDPEDTTDKTLNWSTGDPSVAVVDDTGKVSAVGVGSTTVTATTTDGSDLSVSCLVVVQESNNTPRIRFDKSEVVVDYDGGTATIVPIILPEAFAGSEVEYRIEGNDGNIEFDNGLITGRKKTQGNTTVTIIGSIKGYDSSGLEEAYNQAKANLDEAMINTQRTEEALNVAQTNKTQAEVDYANAQRNTLSKQDDLNIANDNLRIAEAELQTAQANLDKKIQEKADAEQELEHLQQTTPDEVQILNEAIEAKNAAQERYDAAIEKKARGSAAFFEEQGSVVAQAIVEAHSELVIGGAWGDTHLGKKGDTTNLDNMKATLQHIKVGNQLRDQDNNFTNLKPLRVSNTLMAIAQVQTNASSTNPGHLGLYPVNENLAWGYRNQSPFNGWYTMEKKIYDYRINNNVSLSTALSRLKASGQIPQNANTDGHYTNIVNTEIAYTGFAIATQSSAVLGIAHGQVFSPNNFDEIDYTVDEYEVLLNNYIDSLNKEISESKIALDDASKTLEQLQKGGGVAGAYAAMLANAQNKIDQANSAISEAESAKDTAQSKVAERQLGVTNAQQALADAQQQEDEKSDAKDKATIVYNLALSNYNSAKEAEGIVQAAYDVAEENLKGIEAVCKVKVTKTVKQIGVKDNVGQIQVEKGYEYYLRNILTFDPEDAYIGNLVYTSADDSIASVNNEGILTGVGEGETQVIVSVREKPSVTATLDIKIIPAGAYGQILPLDRPASPELIPANLWISQIEEEIEFDPNIKKYEQQFRVYDNKTLLVEGTDYTVKYSNNTKVGKASVTVTGKGNYAGSYVREFDIVQRSIQQPEVIVVLNKDCLVYNNGKVQLPKIASIEYNGVKLKSSEYEIVRDSNDDYASVGQHTFDIRLKGNYTGLIQKSYMIIEKNDTLVSLSNGTLSGVKNMPYNNGTEVVQDHSKLVVKASGKTLSEGTDYEIEYLNNTDAGTAYVIVNGLGNYRGSLTKTFKITPIALNANNTVVDGLLTEVEYTGESYEPDPIVKYGVNTLQRNIDYTLTYKNTDKAGTATVTIKGIGNYSGTINKTFKINKVTLDSDMFNLENDKYEYTKGGVKPLPVSSLIYNKDYTVSYKNNTKLGMATMTIKGKGSYTGSVTLDFEITSQSISSVNISIPDKAFTGKKNAWKSTPVLTDSDGKKLSAGTDYNKNIEYTYQNGRPVGKDDIPQPGTIINVTINTDGLKTNNYKDTIVGTYRIVNYDLSKATIKINSQVYTGRPVTISKDDIISVKIGNVEIEPQYYEIDHTSYINNTNKGSASVTIKGVGGNTEEGCYGGSKTVKFSIVQRNICQIIRFHKNDPDATGTMKDQYIYKDSKLNKNSYKLANKTFVGWATVENPGPTDRIYYDRDTIGYSFLRAGLVTDLYAQWK